MKTSSKFAKYEHSKIEKKWPSSAKATAGQAVKYNHSKIEHRWQKVWSDNKIYQTREGAKKPKAYVLDMFPYPSGDGLHVGHPKGYIATDIYSRFKRMNGFNVLHPMGWDAFGLPAENYAIKNKINPDIAVKKNIKKFKGQLEKIGFDYDWSREINTTDPKYYKWTQWIFLQLYKKGLAFESSEPINWCPSCKTGLANEDLENGKCERCGSEVEKKPLRQWVLKITDYAERLLKDLDGLNWPESVKESQRNWIGKSEGAEISFSVKTKGKPDQVKVFTTRADTLFGATYLVVAPEHPIVERLSQQINNIKEVKRYVAQAIKRNEIERTALSKDKTGVKLEGLTAINPTNGQEIPIWVADYVLPDYGTGAIMAVPAHDDRDWYFAVKYKIPIIDVLAKPTKDGYFSVNIHDEDKGKLANEIRAIAISSEPMAPTIHAYHILNKESSKIVKVLEMNRVGNQDSYKKISSGKNCSLFFHGNKHEIIFSAVYSGEGKLINSGDFNGLPSEKARGAITKLVRGKMVTKYRLRDWVFSRQRYWGEPIPIIHCPKCGPVPVPEKDLPVILPKVKSYEPTGTGESPLSAITKWVNVKCPICKEKAKRETNTMPQWAGSSWYYLRYIDPKNTKTLVAKKKEKYWSPVDMYVGGTEHATRHLIYARFWHKFLFDIGIVSQAEPFAQLKNQGMILGADNRKMSKRWGNVVNPDDIVRDFGADTLRVYEMFMGPFEQGASWSTDNLMGARRFVEKVWRLANKVIPKGKPQINNKRLEILLHKTIKQVTADINNFNYNTVVSALMILTNEWEKAEVILVADWQAFLKMLAPFAPHLAEELWSQLGQKGSIHLAKWPEHDESKLKSATISLVVQINGKTRELLTVPADLQEKEAIKMALANAKIKKWVGDKVPKKIIYIPNRLLNLVV